MNFFCEAYTNIIKTKAANYVLLQPSKPPDRLLTVFSRCQKAVDVLLADFDYESPSRIYLVDAPSLHDVAGTKARGCGGCLQHCIGRKHDVSKFWRPTPMDQAFCF